MSFRTWLSVITLAAIIIILYASRHELVDAWHLLNQVNPWILALVVPAQILSYFAVGAMIFEYLRGKGELKDSSRWQMARMALELNFVNHILPSGGVSGFSYLGWRLKHMGINAGRATMAQVVRFAMAFLTYLILLFIALIFITADGSINRFTILVSTALASTILFGGLFLLYIIGSEPRLKTFSRSLTRWVNNFGRKVIQRKKPLVKEAMIEQFFEELHQDYVELRADKKLLKKPFIWGFVHNLAELGMFIAAFAALGVFVNPAPLLIALGFASIAGFAVLTPGGTGAYEVLMISFLAASGMSIGQATAGILLARVILVLGTIATGYVFYQLAILQHGKGPNARQPDQR